MNCQRVERENLAERYVSGSLEPQLREEFERHYFDCEECARQLETWLAIQKPLREMAPEIRREMAPAGSSWISGAAALAAGVVVLIGVSLLPRTNDSAPMPVAVSRGPDLAELAHLDPPAYAPPALRGAESTAESLFREAMEAYLRRDYARASTGLRASLELDPAAMAPRFFLGASELLSERPADGVRDLERVAASNSPFAEEARFDLAKGYLMLGRRREALDTLLTVASQGGDFADQARTLLERIGGVR